MSKMRWDKASARAKTQRFSGQAAPATQAQRSLLRRMAIERGFDPELPQGLSVAEAASQIRLLKRMKKRSQRGGA